MFPESPVLSVIFLVLEFYALSVILKRVTGASLAVTPVAVASLVILLLFLGGYIIGIRLVSLMIHVAGGAVALLLVAEAVLRVRQHRLSSASGRRVALLLFAIVLALALYRLNRFGAYWAWDEFSHWGTIIRAIWESGTFRFTPDPLYFQDYPPGAALFAFHLLTLTGYSEGAAFFSYAFLVGVFAIPVVAPAFRISVVCGAFAVCTVFLLYFAFANGWSTVLIDHLLAAMFAGVVAVITQPSLQRGNFLVIPVALAALALIKHAGVTLAFLAAIICIAWRLIPSVNPSRPFFQFDSALGRPRHFAVWSIACLAAPLLASQVWSQHVAASGAVISLGGKSVVSLAARSLKCCETPREIQVSKNFFATLYDSDPPPLEVSEPLSTSDVAAGPKRDSVLMKLLFNSREYAPPKVWLSFVLLGFLFAASQRDLVWRRQILVCSMSLVLGAIGYSASLLLYYLYAFSDYEASTLISFTRYHNVFLLGWALVLVALWGMSTMGTKSPTWKLVLIVLVPAWGFWGLSPYVPAARDFLMNGVPRIAEQRVPVRSWALEVAAAVPPTASVYVAWQGSDGREFWQAKHELLPRVTNRGCFSLGDPQRKDDIQTCRWDTLRLKTELANFDFLAIGKGYSYLAGYYGVLLKDGPSDSDSALFKIDRTDGEIRLMNVPLAHKLGPVKETR